MVNKELKKDRMKKYFIDATKEILSAEGVENVSVRKVGEATGYSYATIYNYFSNLEHLLYCTGMDYINDIIGIYDDVLEKGQYSIEDVKRLYTGYIDYFIANPNVFKFFFFHQFELKEEITQIEPQRPSLGKITAGMLSNLSEQGLIDKSDIDVTDDLLTNAVHGLLTMYFSQKRSLTAEQLHDKTEKMIEYLVSKQ